ncbi:MAG TPA: divalent-cation tolerance protein CutA [Methylocella sp.]|nr:divalent-cation tolerance protein CutA [Methylocella sp.]
MQEVSARFALLMTACGSKPEAEAIATLLVEKRLAACVQIFPITSVYRWEGSVERAGEWMLFCKINAADYASAEAAVLAAHSYAVPEVVMLKIEDGAKAYLAWLQDATARG